MDVQMQEKLELIYTRCTAGEDNIITVLQEIQKEFGYIPEEAIMWYSARTSIPAAGFYGVVTFYSQFHLNPRGKNIITVCCGTVCHVKGATNVLNRIGEDLKLKGEQTTTKDMQFTVEKVNCVGACSIAPVVLVNEKVHGKMTPATMGKTIKEYRS